MKLRARALGLVVLLALGACSAPSARSSTTPIPQQPAASTAATPVHATSCGQKLAITQAPKRVVVMNATGLAAMAELGVLDNIVARFGVVDTSLFSGESLRKIEAIPVIGATETGHGHSKVSMESFLEYQPDLFVGTPSGLDVDKLKASGIPMYTPKAYCPGDQTKPATYDGVYEEVRQMGALFGKADKAEEVVASLKSRVAKSSAPKASGTGAALYVTPGDSRFSAYGSSSMVTPQLASAGLQNAFGEVQKRVFDVSMESLLEKNPDHIVVLFQKDEKGALDTFLAAPGASELKAVKKKQVHALPFPLSDPPSPLSITGMEKILAAVR